MGAAIVGESERVVNAVLLVAKVLVVSLPQLLELGGVLQFEVRGKGDCTILEGPLRRDGRPSKGCGYGSLTLGSGSFSICGQILLVLFIFFCSASSHVRGFLTRLRSLAVVPEGAWHKANSQGEVN